jgi:hypothetical protein
MCCAELVGPAEDSAFWTRSSTSLRVISEAPHGALPVRGGQDDTAVPDAGNRDVAAPTNTVWLMDRMTSGAEIATMATGLSAVTAAATWTAGRWRAWRRERAADAERNWHGYIPVGGIDGWDVRLAEDPEGPTARVVVEVLANNAENQAHNLRQVILRDGKLSRAPTTGEWGFLKHLHKKYGYGSGMPVGYPET